MPTATDIDHTLARVRDFVTRSLGAGTTASALAEAAAVDNKSVAQALHANWNPTANTLRKLQGLIPAEWKAGDPLPAAESARRAARAANAAASPGER